MLEEARAGTEEEGETGRVVWLVGGPGSGKAELAREALQGRQGWTVLDTGQLFRDYLDRLAGEEVELHCSARPAGSPRPAFTWWREGQPRLVLGNQANLTIAPLTRHHHSPYRACSLSDVNM